MAPSISTLNNSVSILHQVPEGHVGVYWRGGALLNTITDPGDMVLCLDGHLHFCAVSPYFEVYC